AAELAAALTPGAPCQVCGSADHPAPARTGADHVDRAAEDTAYAAFTSAEEARATAERELAVIREAWSAARAEVLAGPADGEAPHAYTAATGTAREVAASGGLTGTALSGTALSRTGLAATGLSGTGLAATASSSARPSGGPAGGERGADGARGTGAATGGSLPAGRREASRADLTDGREARLDTVPAQGAGSRDAESADRTEAAVSEPSVEELAHEVAELTRQHAEAHALAGQTHGAREALARAEREYESRVGAQRDAERRVAARTSQREALEREQTVLHAELARGRGESGSVAEHASRLERRIAILIDAAETVRTVDSTAQRLKDADDRLADAAYSAGFDTPAAAAAALLEDGERRTLQHRLDAWQAEAAAVADRLAEPETRAAASRPPADPAGAEAAHTAAERTLRDATSALDAVRDRCAELARLSGEADTEVRRLGPLRVTYERVARLAGLTAGTSAENERKMRLESYVLAARLEQVAAAATARLQRMSSGRYTLVHSDARSGGRRAGLGLHVVDAWTGNERDTATLSGGETFFASLALALGLADVVTDEAGGVRLDTLFIDEGFGSLDDQTLDEVLDVLDSLRERDRSVGIVSHVADLRRRIPAQLEVVKERHGSAVRLRTAGGLSD
ncbi:SMC family ATPase, partial [Streptomyces sp. ISL-36]|uniref:SbcC/MukB-like Walker B domain-containing protein n=1 Tax=Streptomyces sp. ISL-36 TaxID=2819182 RepID=UPI001C1D9D97